MIDAFPRLPAPSPNESMTTSPTPATPETDRIGRRAWVAPSLTSHASMTVLTHNVLGVMGAVLLQPGISCTPAGCGNVNPSLSPAHNPSVQPSSSGPPQH